MSGSAVGRMGTWTIFEG